MGGIIGYKDTIGSTSVSLHVSGGCTASVAAGSSLNNLKYRSLARALAINWSTTTAGTFTVRCASASDSPKIAVAALAGLQNVTAADGITLVSCDAYLGGAFQGGPTLTALSPALLDEAREVHVLPFCFKPSIDIRADRFDFVFSCAAASSGQVVIGRAVAMRGIYLEHGFGRDWEIDHDDTSEVAYVGRYGSPSVLRGATFRRITVPIPLASETQLFGDGLSTSYNQNLDDFVRYVGRGDDVLIVPRTSASAGDLFKQRASILGLLDNPLPAFKHRAGRLWNTSITVREAR